MIWISVALAGRCGEPEDAGLKIASPSNPEEVVHFPHGPRSFATSVVSSNIGAGVDKAYGDASTALGVPDWKDGVGAVSLGNPTKKSPAELVLWFENVSITDGPGPDLYVFEVGPLVEPTRISISDDGKTWHDIGVIKGSTRAVDLDGKVPEGVYRFVRLRNAGRATRAPYAGADIDAVGVIGGCLLINV